MNGMNEKTPECCESQRQRRLQKQCEKRQTVNGGLASRVID